MPVRITPPVGQTSVGMALLSAFATGLLRLFIIVIAAMLLGVPSDTFWFVIVALLATGFDLNFR